MKDSISYSSICSALYSPFLWSLVISSNSLIFYLLWSISIWNRSVSRFLLIKSCIGSLTLTLFFIAALAASMRLIFAAFSSYYFEVFCKSLSYLMVMPVFLTPFSHILSCSFLSFYYLFLYFSFSFILKIYASSGMAKGLSYFMAKSLEPVLLIKLCDFFVYYCMVLSFIKLSLAIRLIDFNLSLRLRVDFVKLFFKQVFIRK